MSKLQYTIRNIPEPVDKRIRKRAKATGKSFNQTVVDILTMQTFGTLEPKIDKNFDWLYGKNTLDECFDDAVEELSQVDESLWN